MAPQIRYVAENPSGMSRTSLGGNFNRNLDPICSALLVCLNHFLRFGRKAVAEKGEEEEEESEKRQVPLQGPLGKLELSCSFRCNK